MDDLNDIAARIYQMLVEEDGLDDEQIEEVGLIMGDMATGFTIVPAEAVIH